MVVQLRCRVFAKLFVAWELLTCCSKRAQAMAPKHGGAAPRGSSNSPTCPSEGAACVFGGVGEPSPDFKTRHQYSSEVWQAKQDGSRRVFSVFYLDLLHSHWNARFENAQSGSRLRASRGKNKSSSTNAMPMQNHFSIYQRRGSQRLPVHISLLLALHLLLLTR